MSNAKLLSCAIVLVTSDIKKTVKYYNELLGFKIVTHYENEEKFAACYRGNVEIVLVELSKDKIESNQDRYGAGYDAYLVPEDVDSFYKELKDKEVKIVDELAMTVYGSYEFAIEDIDGRRIGIGRVRDKKKFFYK
jgi:catechol 2,3-dioxygenase-like lactoylglutathione lyase family enzyme